MKEDEDDIETSEELRNTRFTEVVALLFVTLVIIFLVIKILFY